MEGVYFEWLDCTSDAQNWQLTNISLIPDQFCGPYGWYISLRSFLYIQCEYQPFWCGNWHNPELREYQAATVLAAYVSRTSAAMVVTVQDKQILGIQEEQFNSLASGKFEWNFRYVIFKQILRFDISCEIALIWMSLDLADDHSTLVRVMALSSLYKQLPEPMLTQISVTIWRHKTTMS